MPEPVTFNQNIPVFRTPLIWVVQPALAQHTL
jgi:hypothetical protein